METAKAEKNPTTGGVFSAVPHGNMTRQQISIICTCFPRSSRGSEPENVVVPKEVFDMMTWWCEKGIDGFRMDVISLISKVQEFPDGTVGESGYGDFSPYCANGPRVHEFLQEMNRKVLSKYDLITVGECSGVTIDEAKKYASSSGNQLNMIFQFEHMDLDGGETLKCRTIECVYVLSELQACPERLAVRASPGGVASAVLCVEARSCRECFPGWEMRAKQYA